MVAGETVLNVTRKRHTRREAGSQRHGTLGSAGPPNGQDRCQVTAPLYGALRGVLPRPEWNSPGPGNGCRSRPQRWQIRSLPC
jgi:hypothetical protein